MTSDEIISLGKHKVRSNNDLMLFYLDDFFRIFGRKPVCAGCTFDKDWKKYVNSFKTKTTMATKTTGEYVLSPKYSGTILTYKIGKQPYRTYGRKITDAFAEAFLTNGTDKEIADRKKMFVKLPEPEPANPFESMTGKQLDAYAEEHNITYPEGVKLVKDKKAYLAENS